MNLATVSAQSKESVTDALPMRPPDYTATPTYSRLAWSAVGLGCLLRLIQYGLNRSLWMDEAYLALNILHRSWAGLFQTLDNHQGAPVIFLLLEKSAVHLLGSSDYALRLLPFLAGLPRCSSFTSSPARPSPPLPYPSRWVSSQFHHR